MLNGFLDSYMPHGYCYLWRPDVLWLNVLSDGGIALAYFSIPVTLTYFLLNRRDLPFRHVFYLFTAFILFCGVTHVLSIWVVWHGTYGAQGLVKLVTALVSITTAITLYPLMPRVLALRSPTELERVNRRLEAEAAARRDTENRLRRTETQLRTYLELAPDGMLIVDETGKIQFANALSETVFGYPRDELVGRTVEDLLPASTRARHQDHRARYFAAPRQRLMASGMDLYGRRRRGDEFPVEISLSPVQLRDQTVVLATIRDVSERKALEAQVRQRQAELTHVARLNTVGEMASGLAHELNQPLTAISHHCDAALLTLREAARPDPELVEIVQDIDQQARRAGGIIRGLRQLVKKDTATAPTDLNALVDDTLRLLQPEAREKRIHIASSVPPRLPSVNVDPIQIQQVLINLVHNSVEALEHANDTPREVTITVAAEDGAWVRVSVRDTGPGLAQTIREQLFSAFRTTKPTGMGLGLSISRSIVEAHGGRLWLDESITDATTFHFTVPLTAS